MQAWRHDGRRHAIANGPITWLRAWVQRQGFLPMGSTAALRRTAAAILDGACPMLKRARLNAKTTQSVARYAVGARGADHTEQAEDCPKSIMTQRSTLSSSTHRADSSTSTTITTQENTVEINGTNGCSAAQNGNVEVVRALLAAGAAKDQATHDGATPSERATMCNAWTVATKVLSWSRTYREGSTHTVPGVIFGRAVLKRFLCSPPLCQNNRLEPKPSF